MVEKLSTLCVYLSSSPSYGGMIHWILLHYWLFQHNCIAALRAILFLNSVGEYRYKLNLRNRGSSRIHESIHCKKCNSFSSLWNLLSLIYKKNAIFLKLHKNPCQTSKITPNVVPTSQPQLSEQWISYCWNVKALWVPSMHCSMNKLCSYCYRFIVLLFADYI